VVFATDAPLGPIAPTIKVMDDLGLDPATHAKIMVGNAERLMNMAIK
jgi:predicted TIM-barrel fold metal-dependent hydrolase